MDWKHLLAYITGTVDQELLLRNEYLVTENRILRQQVVYGNSADNSHHLKTGYNAPSQLMWEGATPWYRIMYSLSSSYLYSSGSSSSCTSPGPSVR